VQGCADTPARVLVPIAVKTRRVLARFDCDRHLDAAPAILERRSNACYEPLLDEVGEGRLGALLEVSRGASARA
jgi:hypothetical protein